MNSVINNIAADSHVTDIPPLQPKSAKFFAWVE